MEGQKLKGQASGYGSINKNVALAHGLSSIVTNVCGMKRDERQPLLLSGTDPVNDTYERSEPSGTPRPDLRCSPERTDIETGPMDKTLTPGGDSIGVNPLFQRELEHPTSNAATMIHLLKGNIGTGILAMPDAFRNSGLALGTIATLFIGAICTHCMHMLVRSAHELCVRTGQPSLTFSEVSEAALATGPAKLRCCAKYAKVMVNVFLCLTQLGFCCVYFLFVATNLMEVGRYFMDVNLGVYAYLLIILVPMILLNWIKNLKYLTPISAVATILTIIGLVITFSYLLRGLPRTSTVKAFSSWSQLPIYFGTAIYAFEGIGMVLPLENNMKNPQDFGGWNGVLNTIMVFVACLYTAVGFFGYLKYGDAVRLGSITLNLPNEILAQLVRVMMAFAIFFSYGLQFYVPMNIVWPLIRPHLRSENSQKMGEYILRSCLVIVTFGLAAAIPNLSAVISLVGAFSSSALALIFPPVIEIITFWHQGLGKKNWILWKDIAIIIFGFSGFIFGTYVNLSNIISPKE